VHECKRIQQLVHAAADRELDVKDSLLVQTHVARCEECRDHMLNEQTFLTLMTTVLEPPRAPERTRRAVREALANEVARVRRRKRRRWTLVGTAVVVLLLAVGAFIAMRHAGVPNLVNLALSEHRHYMNDATRLQVYASDVLVVEHWLDEQAPFPLHIPPHNGDLHLAGAIVTPAPEASAILAYDWSGQTVTLLIAPAQPMSFDEASAMTFRNMLFHTTRLDGRQVLQWSDDQNLYVLVSCREFPIAALPFDVRQAANASG
jgi:anti-sigma factor RsiW